MSDQTGVFQHAIYTVPNFHEGYAPTTMRAPSSSPCCSRSSAKTPRRSSASLPAISRFSGTRSTETNPASGIFHELFPRVARIARIRGQPCPRALGGCHGARPLEKRWHRSLCALLFQRGLPPVARFSSPRAWAFTLIAIHEYLRTLSATASWGRCATRLRRCSSISFSHSSADWHWFERIVTYDNAKAVARADPERILDVAGRDAPHRASLAPLAPRRANGGGRPFLADRMPWILARGGRKARSTSNRWRRTP